VSTLSADKIMEPPLKIGAMFVSHNSRYATSAIYLSGLLGGFSALNPILLSVYGGVSGNSAESVSCGTGSNFMRSRLSNSFKSLILKFVAAISIPSAVFLILISFLNFMAYAFIAATTMLCVLASLYIQERGFRFRDSTPMPNQLQERVVFDAPHSPCVDA
jgi:hypothetical protein